MNNYIFYPSCFEADRINQCRYSLLRLLWTYNLRPPANLRVVVHTKAAALFELFQPFFSQFSVEETGHPQSLDMPSLVQTVSVLYTGNFLFLPSHTIFTRPPGEIFQHIQNGKVVLKKNGQSNAAMVRSDFAGISGGNENRSLLTTYVSLGGKPTGSVPAAIEESSTIAWADAAVEVYKPFHQLNKQLKQFFHENEEESLPNLVKKAHRLNLEGLLQEKEGFDRLPFWQKWIRRFTGRQWKLQNYSTKLSP